MKRYAAFVALLLINFYSAYAGHISGGEIFYKYLGPGSAPNTEKYTITLRLFRDAFAQVGSDNVAQMPNVVTLGVFRRTSASAYAPYQTITQIQRSKLETINLTPNAYPCIIPAPIISYQIGYFEYTIELPKEQWGYTVAFQTCCRANGITNMVGYLVTAGSYSDGATYVANISGTGILGSQNNSSPQFLIKDTAVICANNPFQLDFGALDPDSDSLSYSFCSAYDRGNANNASDIPPSDPPYDFITYTTGFSGSQPLGNNVSINPETGLITGTAPAQGKYVINVCIDEWRNHVRIGSHRKDFILEVKSCTIAKAALEPQYVNCDSLTTLFENLSNSPLIKSWFWDFGLPGKTSTQEKPSFTFPAAGEYPVKLVVNRGGQCPDSITTIAKIYPGFFPDFEVAGSCILNDFQFTDKSITNYGTISKWAWSFGDETSTADASTLQNPTWKYSTTGLKEVECIIESSVGCSAKVVAKDVQVLAKPVISLAFRDTLICSEDTLALNATGSGAFSWTPNVTGLTRFNNTAHPEVFPKSTTSFKLTLDDEGCINTDSVRVRVVDFVTLDVGPPVTICLTDPVTLNTSGDGLYFEWSPSATLDDPAKQAPVATPVDPTTTYTVVSKISDKCFTDDQIVVHTVPYPVSDAGADIIICYDDTTRLDGRTDGSSFNWSPASTLINAETLTPQAYPLRTTSYILSSWDTRGCPKPGLDTMTVIVRPQIFANAGNDTSIVAGQPLLLNGSGSDLYEWSPSPGLSNPLIKTPVATLSDDMTYIMKTYTTEGCYAYDTMNVRVFKTLPDIFVPNAFTPGKSTNSFFRPIPVGIAYLQAFQIYNRWGQMVYSSTDASRGWDGKVGGKDQPSGTFVWMAKGVDYTGKIIVKKGTMILIR